MNSEVRTHLWYLGYDFGKNGPTTRNCYNGLFMSPDHTKVWETGKAAGERDKAKTENRLNAQEAIVDKIRRSQEGETVLISAAEAHVVCGIIQEVCQDAWQDPSRLVASLLQTGEVTFMGRNLRVV